MKRLAVLILFLSFSKSFFAQEIESALKVYNKPEFQFKSSINIVQLNDTLGLPFIDDFSANYLAPIIKDTSGLTYSVVKQYKYIQKDSSFYFTKIPFSTDTAKYYSVVNNVTTSTNKAPVFEVVLFDYTNYPVVAKDTFPVWVPYSLRDTNSSGKFDTIKSKVIEIVNDSNDFVVLPVTTNKWIDNNVSINDNYPIAQPSVGVATFDALDYSGNIHSHAKSTQFLSEYLTSKPIDLSANSLTDSLYLRFYLQRKGNGDLPEDMDSLLVQFKDSLGIWSNVWSTKRADKLTNSSFTEYVVPVKDAKYLFKGFQFRFGNYASLTSQGIGYGNNADHWNLDYVYFAKGQKVLVDPRKDMVFLKPPTTMLNGYYSIPWKHYTNPSAITLTSSKANIKNHSGVSSSTDFSVKITEGNNTTYSSASPQTASVGGQVEKEFTESYSGSVFSSTNTETAIFKIKYKLTDNLGGLNSNDSCMYNQEFKNYYAYDDGSAESGYGINVYGGKVAYYFPLLIPSDTLTGISIYFNSVLGSENITVPISLKVWAEQDGFPSTELFTSNVIFPQNSDSLNKYLNYALSSKIKVTGSFFIGWEQNSANMVNVGYDKNSNASDKTFYNVDGTWKKSSLNGALMLRPLFGKIENPVSKQDFENIKVNIYPNPSTDVINIQVNKNNVSYEVYSLLGEQISAGEFNQTKILNLGSFSKGIYLVRLNINGRVITEKVLVK